MKYSLTMTADNPIVQGHRVYGEKLLPGLAYIDMLYQLVDQGLKLDYRKHCLKRLAIYHPLVVSENSPVKLEIGFDRVADHWKITVRNAGSDAPGNPLPEKVYLTAELHATTIAFTEQLDLDTIKQATNRCVDLETVYAAARERGLIHQGMIKACGKAYQTEFGFLMEVNVDEAYHEEGKKVLFHPTLIDGVAMAAAFLADAGTAGSNDELYLPVVYESFYALEPLRTHCYARVNAASLHMVNDIRTTDVAFFNAAGKQIALLTGITAKRIRAKEQFNPDVINALHPPAVQENSGCETSSPYQLETTSTYIEARLRKIFSRRLDQPAAQLDIHAGFYEIGLESAQLMTLVQEIEESFHLSLSPTLLFENNSISQLIDCIKNEKQATVSIAHFGPDTADRAAVGEAEPVAPQNARAFVQDIAVIGVSGRYPGARNVEEFWENLKAGKDCIREIPKDRWDHSLYFDEDKNKSGKTYCKWGGFIEDVGQFDPLFFNLSPGNAAMMDPMDRLFLETVWNLLENTGYTQETLQRQYQSQVGVYVGAMYQHYHYCTADQAAEALISVSSYSSIANRVSYFFNLQGPSVAVDTACSASAMAIHLACESLLKGECRLAIAGGVNLSIHPNKYLGLSQMQILGSHINSRSFANGDGFLPAEGVGAVLLKPLAAAIGDGDSILAVIKSTATNHGGRMNGYFVPNPNAQVQLFEANFKKSGIDPRTISYVEAAANGTVLGDPAEINALKKTFQKHTTDQQFCAIGAVKSNIGHAEAASGISQLTKVILQLQHQQLVPTIKVEPLNPNISFEQSPFYLQRELQQWKRPVVMVDKTEQEFPRRATVSSFGAGGSNVHLIIEEYIPATAKMPSGFSPAGSPQIVLFSAKNQEQLVTVVQQMNDFLAVQKGIALPNLAYTLQVGREAMSSRLALIVSSIEELVLAIKGYLGEAVEVAAPVFEGDLDEDRSNMKSMLSGTAEQAVLQVFLAQHDLEKIAQYWTQGGDKMPWEKLHEGREVHRISLPTYPFRRNYYWIEEQGAEAPRPDAIQPVIVEAPGETIDNTELTPDDIQSYLVQLFAQQLRLPRAQIKVNQKLQTYGLDSIFVMKLMRDFESRFKIKITGREMLELHTIHAIAEYLDAKLKALPQPEVDDGAPNKTPLMEIESAAVAEADALEQFKQGVLTLEEIESLLDKGVI